MAPRRGFSSPGPLPVQGALSGSLTLLSPSGSMDVTLNVGIPSRLPGSQPMDIHTSPELPQRDVLRQRPQSNPQICFLYQFYILFFYSSIYFLQLYFYSIYYSIFTIFYFTVFIVFCSIFSKARALFFILQLTPKTRFYGQWGGIWALSHPLLF